MLELSTENILLRKLRLAFLKIDDPRALHEPFVRKNRAVLDTFLTPVLFLRYGRASLERLVETAKANNPEKTEPSGAAVQTY